MYSKIYNAWFKAGLDAWVLGAKAGAVIALRMVRMTTGDAAAAREAEQMVTEKIKAGLELQAGLIGEGLRLTPLSGTQKTLQHYRIKVAANKRRLSR